MFRAFVATGVLAASLAAQSPSADVRVVLRTAHSLIGVMGGKLNVQQGGASESAIVRIVFNGRRIASSYATGSGHIIDFNEQKTYAINGSLREYSVRTFAEAAQASARSYRATSNLVNLGGIDQFEDRLQLPDQTTGRVKRFQYRAEVTETGRRKTVAGKDTREVIVSVTAWDGRKTFDEDGGWIATSSLWLAARIPAVDGLVAAQRRYAATLAKGAYDGVFTPVELPGYTELVLASFPELASVASRTIAEMDKLDGTVLEHTTTYQIAWKVSEARWRKVERLTDLVTIASEYVAIAPVALESDLAIPPGFTLKKR